MDNSIVEEIDHRAALKKNVLLWSVCIAITPMILVSCIILYQFRISYHQRVNAHLEELVAKHRQDIDTFLKERLGNIQVLAGNFSFENMSNERFLQERLNILQQNYGPVFVDLGVINFEGFQVAYAGPYKLKHASYSDADWFKKAMANNSEYYKSDVFLGLRGVPHFIIAVRRTSGDKTWIVRATIDFVYFNSLVEKIRIGETGFAFILNNEGKFQTHAVHDVAPDKSPYRDFLKYNNAEKKEIHIVEHADASGSTSLYVASFLKHGDWMLVYQQKSSEAFADYRRAVSIAIVIVILGCVLILSTAIILTNKLVRLLTKIDREKEMMNEQIVETGKLASIGELAAGIAHEINNPVAIMVGEAGWIEDLLEEEEFQASENMNEFKRALKQIHIQGKRCKEITHKLLSFARKTGSRPQDINVNELIEELVDLSAQRAKFSNVTIVTDFKEDMPSICVSQSELQQVFLNLINNALDAMEKDGGDIRISTRTDGNRVVVVVADTGPGIPSAVLNRIFDPFFTTKPVGKGTGLGLSICYGIIKKMRGEIEVQSTVGVGTTFLVKIPLPED
ncbi:ATPase/histidine kinase/DNA gyrase B/HSP90 domain protein [uncultured Desulfobacterium sp.]|uniref:histidine kinase n=1 Tax=uncultured Desulfobacterium sp. TaxID=201089 RepID=A0A445MYE9_9BACT|nr:ATPase/histidine kinase/DNA gyrase B/HSP90 domain protein [uncultured Desulfobacterium sp.]